MDGVRSNLGWRIPCWMVLWAGAILHCSFHMAQAQNEEIPIVVDPPIPMATQEVLMSPPIPTGIIFCAWFRQQPEEEPKEIIKAFPSGAKSEIGPGYTGRETVHPNCSLHIKELTLNDNAIYRLVEGGLGGSNSGSVTLTVVEHVWKPNVVILPAPFVQESQSIQLLCNTTVTHEVRWIKDGILLDDGYDFKDFNRTISISSTTRKDMGGYKCRVSNGIISVESDSAHLSVIYGPETPVIHPNEACNQEHKNIILTCQAASSPEPRYTWLHNDVLVDYGPKLFIENFNEGQAGVYVCNAMNEFLQQEKTSLEQQIRLERSCVSAVTITGPADGTEDKAISLDCRAEGDVVEYSWWSENQPVQLDDRVSLSNEGRTLNFNPCLRRDAADYTCRALNSFSSGDSSAFGLSIIYGPDPPFINETIDINQETVTLRCVAVAHPATENLWFRNGVQVEDNPQVLVLQMVPENSGEYTCQATNPTSKAQRETTLEIDMIGKLRSLRRR